MKNLKNLLGLVLLLAMITIGCQKEELLTNDENTESIMPVGNFKGAGTADFLYQLIDDLLGCGVLNAGNANALTVKANAWISSIERGNSNSAKGQAQAFVNQVKAFVRTGVLTSDQGEDLIAGIRSVDLRDFQAYPVVRIGTQIWTAQNLKYVPSSGNYWCYNNDPANCATYGKLYDWNTAIADNHGNGKDICPTGWHMPTDSEVMILESYLGMNGTDLINYGDEHTRLSGEVGKKLKSASGWYLGGNGVNSNGLNILPSGWTLNGAFYSLTSHGYIWTSTEHNSTRAMYRRFGYHSDGVKRYRHDKNIGFPIRCILD